MSEKNPNEEEFCKETEDDSVYSPDTYVMWAERELQFGNMEGAIEYLEKAIEEAKTYIDPKTPEKYEYLLEELKAGKRTSLIGDPHERWLPSGVPPPYNPTKPIDILKKRPEEQIQNEKRILTELYEERDEMQVKELAELFNLKEFDTLLALKLYIKQGLISARVFETTRVIKFLKDE